MVSFPQAGTPSVIKFHLIDNNSGLLQGTNNVIYPLLYLRTHWETLSKAVILRNMANYDNMSFANLT